MDTIETARLAIQSKIDATKNRVERNRLGQFATPPEIALEIARFAQGFLPKNGKVRFLDPAIGTGSFYSALKKTFPTQQIDEAVGFEIDPAFATAASNLWAKSGLAVKTADFTLQKASARFNLLICNPPYVRHHHLRQEDKVRLQKDVYSKSGMKLSRLAGLYCHFLGLSHGWMADNGIGAWLIPSEFMDVNYGQAVKNYLLTQVTLLHVHRFDPNDVQFTDALVSSAIVLFRKATPPKNHEVNFTFGGSLLKPKTSRPISVHSLFEESKWTRFPVQEVRSHLTRPTVADFFEVRRGLATGNNDFFILTKQAINEKGLPMEAFRPIFPSPRYLPSDEVLSDADGNPALEQQLFLLDTRLSENEIKKRYPRLLDYLNEGKRQGFHEGYLCSHRSPWYSQENRLPAPIVCSYIGRIDTARKRPFRFILNHSKATVTNGYLAMYPTARLSKVLEHDPLLMPWVWKALLKITSVQLLSEGRVYGGGMHKLEPKELAKVDATQIEKLLSSYEKPSLTTALPKNPELVF